MKSINQLTDDQVMDWINFGFGIKMYDIDKAVRSRNIPLATCRPYDNGHHPCSNTNTCKGHWNMPQMRDLLKSLIVTNCK